MPSEIFISYSWKEASKQIADELEIILKEKKMNIVRDVHELGYKGLIKEFMQRIGKGKYVILVISDPYLKSENCMFELIQVYKSGKFHERIFPIVLDSAKIYKAADRLDYVHFWEQEIKMLEEKMKQGSLASLHGIYQDLDLYSEIRQHIAQLAEILKNINALSVRAHQQEKYADLVKAIEKQIKTDAEGENVETVPPDPELDTPADDSFEAKRIRTLNEKIEVQYGLLAQYEEKLDLNSDPKEDLKIRNEITRIRKRIKDYKDEINMIRG